MLSYNALLLAGCLVAATHGLVHGPWSNPADSPDDRAKALVANMTLDEKLAMLHGPLSGPCCQCKTAATCAYVGNVVSNKRLDIPPINMNDGPQGFRDNNAPGTTTAWPSGLTMAASWDTAAMLEWGTGMGKEFFDKGANVQLGPGLCLARVPRNGRNFEYLSGEDPFLGYQLVQPVITGIQSQKVVANAKHYVLNNQETNRNAVSELADERTRFEMYYPPFLGAATADCGSVMCSYNKINGAWSCENAETLARNLKKDAGFKGYVMSDWGATHSTSIMEGLDVEMPSANHMNPTAIKAGIAAKNITEAAVDESVFRILRAMFAVGVMDEPSSSYDWGKLQHNVTSDAAAQTARRLSAVSTVLLKNTGGVLPLPINKKLALIGFAGDAAVVHGGGSGSVVPSFIVSPLAGITAQAGTGATITFNNGTDLAAAAAVAADADYAIVFVGTLSHEGGDRASLSLDDGCTDTAQCKGNANNQNALIEAVAKASKNVIVVASVPGAILMPWSGSVSAVLVNFMPGQQAGNAIADVLFGAVNPSGRLPLTMPNHENETDFSPAQWPGLPDPSKPTYANYSEGLLVGYRFYDHHNIRFTTGFPFGHGLSYSTFAFSDLKISKTEVSCSVTNNGPVGGQEVVQVYLAFPPSAGEPPYQLKGFAKTGPLPPNGKTTVSIPLNERSFSVWDTASHAFAVAHGQFGVHVGQSSRNFALSGTITV